MMMVTPLDLLAILALLGVIIGMGAVTFRTLSLMFRDMRPERGAKARALVLVAWAAAYLLLVGMDVPGVLTALATNGGGTETATVAKTTLLAGWLWTLFTILPMLARGTMK